jgi:hypothetical protein
MDRTTAQQQIKLRFFQSNSLKHGTLPSSAGTIQLENPLEPVYLFSAYRIKLGRRLSLLFILRKSTSKMCNYSLHCRLQVTENKYKIS